MRQLSRMTNDPNDDVIPIERHMDTLPIFCPRRGALSSFNRLMEVVAASTTDGLERDLRWLEKNKNKEVGLWCTLYLGGPPPAHVSRFGPIVAGFAVREVR